MLGEVVHEAVTMTAAVAGGVQTLGAAVLVVVAGVVVVVLVGTAMPGVAVSVAVALVMAGPPCSWPCRR